MNQREHMHGKTRTYVACLMLASTLVALGGCDVLLSDQARIEKAKHLLATGEHRAAMIQLKKLLQSSPDHREGRLLLGQASLASGDFAAAEKELVRARDLGIPAKETMVPLGQALLAQGKFETVLEEIDPSAVDQAETRVAILMLRGDAYLGSRNLEQAEKTFRDALAVQPDALDPRIGLARVEQGRRNFRAAEDYIGAVVTADPSHVTGWVTAGELKMAQRNFAAAETAFTRALENAPSRLTVTQEFIARSGLAESQWRQGKSAAALKNVERLLQLAPGHPRPRYFRALMAYGAGDYDTAVENLQQVLRVAPNFRPAQLLLGAAHYAQGNLEQADMYVSSMLAADPSNVFARKLLAATRLRQDKAQDAVDTLTPALTQGINDTELLGLMSRASFQIGDTETGLLYLERGAKADPENEALQLQLAAGYLTAGDLEHAIEILESLPETEEGAYRRELLLILAYLRKRDTASALAQARKVLERRPNDAGAYNLLGTVHMVAGQLDEARRHLDKALSLQPDNAAVLMNLGRLDYRQGNQDGARARFERVLEISPKNASAMVALAQLSALRGDQAQVAQWLERAVAADPKAVAPRLLLLRHYLMARDLERARTLATDLAKAHPENADVNNAHGIVQMANRQYREAAESFSRAVRQAPKVANYRYNLARAQLALQNFGETKLLLAKALELQPEFLAATVTLAALEMREGKAEEALARARSLQQNEDTSGAGHALEGDLRMMQRQYPEAAQAYDNALKRVENSALVVKAYEARKRGRLPDAAAPLERWLDRHPEDARVRFELAKAYQVDGRNKAAIEQYQLILKVQPDRAVVLNNLAWLYHMENDPRAVETAERAHQLEPQSGAISDTLGWILVQRGQVKRGLELLHKAAQQSPDIPDIRYHLAVALAQSGEKEAARRTLTELINSGKNFEDRTKAKRLLEQL